MIDYHLSAPNAATLAAALPGWMKTGDGDIIPAAHTHALEWGIALDGDTDFHAIVRLVDTDRAAEMELALADFIVPEPEVPWQVFA